MLRRYAWLAVLCTLPALAAPAASPKNELGELRNRIQSLQKEVESAEGAKADASEALRHSEQAISTAGRKLHELSQQHQETRGTVARLQQDSAKTRARAIEQQAQLGKLLTRMALRGQHDTLEILFGQQDPSQLARHLRYYADISRARAELIRELRGNLQQIDSLAEAEKKKAAELARIQAEQAKQKKRLEKERGARKNLLSKLDKKIASQRREIGKLQNDEKRLTQLIERLNRLAAERAAKAAKAAKKAKSAAPGKPGKTLHSTVVPSPGEGEGPFRQLKGALRLPIKGELINRFGTQREDGGLTWKGLFIRATTGQPVKAVASGQVVFSDWLRGFGNIVIIDHGGGYMSLYGNNETLLKQAGDDVKTGDTVAGVGNSGGIADSGLYFELRYQSKPFDPLPWISMK
jgi:septal ring factor EnvC (AmiA/AmiB activator)